MRTTMKSRAKARKANHVVMVKHRSTFKPERATKSRRIKSTFAPKASSTKVGKGNFMTRAVTLARRIMQPRQK